MFDFLRSREKVEVDFGFLGVDMHAHWLPGIDDGAKEMEQSLAMIRAFQELGYRHLIATPHIMSEYYPNTPDIIRGKLAAVREACAGENIAITLDAAAEYMIDDTFEAHAERYGLLTLPGNRVLVEFGFYTAPADAAGILFRLQAAGYRPVLAHPERYPYYHREVDKLTTFANRGVELQVNLLSLTGHYGRSVQSAAESLISLGVVSFLGSDAHRTEHIGKIGEAVTNRKSRRVVDSSAYLNSTLSNS